MNIKTSVERIRGTSNYDYLVQVFDDDNTLIAAASVVNGSLKEAAKLATTRLKNTVAEAELYLKKAGLL